MSTRRLLAIRPAALVLAQACNTDVNEGRDPDASTVVLEHYAGTAPLDSLRVPAGYAVDV